MGRHPKDNVKLTREELAAAFSGPWAEQYPPVLNVQQAADLLQVKVSTIYHKRCEGQLDDTFTKMAGKLRFWRDKLVRKVFEEGM